MSDVDIKALTEPAVTKLKEIASKANLDLGKVRVMEVDLSEFIYLDGLDQGNQIVVRELYQREQKIEGDLNQTEQETTGSVFQSRQIVGKDLWGDNQEIIHNLYIDHSTVQGDIVITSIKNGDKEAQRTMDRLSAEPSVAFTLTLGELLTRFNRLERDLELANAVLNAHGLNLGEEKEPTNAFCTRMDLGFEAAGFLMALENNLPVHDQVGEMGKKGSKPEKER
ncbi:MAG: hypothetical protein JXA43_01490 [Candidatus Diapherotrites archaeon]|nr:hypothetical protein [Candidatus Diapherotrites archaeon]